jgi:hypothetical protein
MYENMAKVQDLISKKLQAARLVVGLYLDQGTGHVWI